MHVVFLYNLEHLLLYSMLCRLLNYLSNDLEKLNRNFFWGEDDGQRKIHTLFWQTSCIEKWIGGLGFKVLRHMLDIYLK